MQRRPLTLLELDVLVMRAGDTRHQLVVLTDTYHGATFSQSELESLKRLDGLLAELEVTAKVLREVWRARWTSGQESDRSGTRGADAAGPARPGDDVPPGTAR
jgi:hypothetical protein